MRFRIFSVVAGLALAVALTVAVGTAGSARGISAFSKGQAAAPAASAPDALATLYDNSTNDSGIGIVSQNFESSFDAYDSRGADDFTVPGHHKYKVKQVVAYGVYFNGSGPAASVNVTFYTTKKGKPNESVIKKNYSAVAIASDSGGTFTVKLPTTAALSGGTGSGKKYWVSVQANMDFSSGGEWGWETSTNAPGTEAQWENPGDGFGTGCTTYNNLTTCIPSGEGPSFMATLKGVDTTF